MIDKLDEIIYLWLRKHKLNESILLFVMGMIFAFVMMGIVEFAF